MEFVGNGEQRNSGQEQSKFSLGSGAPEEERTARPTSEEGEEEYLKYGAGSRRQLVGGLVNGMEGVARHDGVIRRGGTSCRPVPEAQ